MLSDLPGGPPDNHGLPDDEVIYDIVDEACQDRETDDDDSDDDSEVPQPQLQRPRFQTQVPQARSHVQTTPPPVFNTTTTTNRNRGDIEILTSQIRDALIVSVLVYFSNTETFHSLLGRIVPVNFKTFDEETQVTIVNVTALSLAVGAAFYIIKVYMEPPNIVLKLVQMYYS